MSSFSKEKDIKNGQAWNLSTSICIEEGQQHNYHYRFAVYYAECQLNDLRTTLKLDDIPGAIDHPELVTVFDECRANIQKVLNKLRTEIE